MQEWARRVDEREELNMITAGFRSRGSIRLHSAIALFNLPNYRLAGDSFENPSRPPAVVTTTLG
jgi:hypothetical protein